MFGIPPFYLGHLGCVPVYVLPEALITLLLIASVANGTTDFIVLTVVVLTTILLHEFGHAVVAGIAGMSGMTILVGALGGLCLYQGSPDPRRQIAISLAGPLANLLLVALLYSPGILIYRKARQHHGLRGMNPLEQTMTAALLGCALLAGYKVMDGSIPLS